MNILKIGSGVERTSNLNEYNKVSTNPFANTNFRGNVLPFVDVFEGAKKAGTGLNIKNKLKMISGSILGNVSDFGKNVYEPVKSFAGRIKENWTLAWGKTVDKGMELKNNVSEKLNSVFKGKDYVAETTPIGDLRKMFQEELEAMGGLSV